MTRNNSRGQNLNTYTVDLIEDPDGSGDVILPIPEEILESLGLKIGDEIVFHLGEDGHIYITKKHDKEKDNITTTIV